MYMFSVSMYTRILRRATKDCEKALDLNPVYMKAITRAAQAQLKLGCENFQIDLINHFLSVTDRQASCHLILYRYVLAHYSLLRLILVLFLSLDFLSDCSQLFLIYFPFKFHAQLVEALVSSYSIIKAYFLHLLNSLNNR